MFEMIHDNLSKNISAHDFGKFLNKWNGLLRFQTSILFSASITLFSSIHLLVTKQHHTWLKAKNRKANNFP